MRIFGFELSVTKAAPPSGTLSSVPGSSRGWWPLIRESFTGAWQRNRELVAEDYLQSPVVYACHTLICNDIGKLRGRLVERTEDGIWQELSRPSPLAPVLRRPNRYQNHIQFKQCWINSKLRWGNTYVLKRRDARNVVTQMYILDPQRVQPMVTPDGSVWYQLSADNMGDLTQAVMVPASEIIHDRMNCLYHPLVGISPLYAAAIAAGIGIRAQDNMASFYFNGGRPSGILIAPGALDQANAEELKEKWKTNFTGANAGKIAILADGFKFEPIGENAVDSELIKTLDWSDARICSVYHVPAYMVGVGAAPAYNNIEALGQDYYSKCLQSLIEEMEACVDEGLGMDPELTGMGYELDLTGLLRMDSKSQMETLKTGVEAKVLTIDDARRRLNFAPLPGGDTVYLQQQDFPIQEIRKNKIAAAPPAPALPAPTPAPTPAPAAPAGQEASAAELTRRAIASFRSALKEAACV